MMTEPTDTVVIKPPADLRSAANPELWGLLSAVMDKDVAVDMSEVESLDGRCLETLLAARKVWAGAGRSFSIIEASDNFRQDAEALGAAKLLSLSDEGDQA